MILLAIILILLLLGGTGYGYRSGWYGSPYGVFGSGLVGVIVVIVIVMLVLGRF